MSKITYICEICGFQVDVPAEEPIPVCQKSGHGTLVEKTEPFNLEGRAEWVADRTDLTMRQAEVYILRNGEGYTHGQVAEELEISEGNARGKWADIKKKVHDAEDKIEKAENTADLL